MDTYTTIPGAGEASEPFKVAVSVDCVIFGYEENTLKVLLMPSEQPENGHSWLLPGDAIRPEETLEAAAWRVLQHYGDLNELDMEQVHAFGTLQRHPLGRVVSVSYYALVNIAQTPFNLQQTGLQWCEVKRLPYLPPDHRSILDTCYRRLQHKLNDQPIGMDLLPEKFSLRTLQTLYEAILDVKLDRRNFRKKFFNMDILIDLHEEEDCVPHRPARLYKFDPGKYDLRKKRQHHF